MLRMMRVSASCILATMLTSLPLSSRACKCSLLMQSCGGTLACAMLRVEAQHALTVCRRGRVSYAPSYLRSSFAEEDIGEDVMEAQWRSYVDKLRQSGELSSCLALADVSASMSGQPMVVSSSPFHARLLTSCAISRFHQNLSKRSALGKSLASILHSLPNLT